MIVATDAALSLIIVNYFSEVALAGCLRSIAEQAEEVEVVVVDNGSRPELRAPLQIAHPTLRWEAMPENLGFAAACNHGARLAASDGLLFLNPDTVVLPGSLSSLVRALASEVFSEAILGCRLLDRDGSVQPSCRRFPSWRTFVSGRQSLLTRCFPGNPWSSDYLMSDFDHRTLCRVDWVSGAALALTRRCFERLGGFDPTFFLYFEDVDMCRRASQLGMRTYYFPEALVEHHQVGASSGGRPRRALFYRHQSMWRYYRRYHRNSWLDPVAMTLIFARMALLAAFHRPGALLPPAAD
jgi:GT2 family glycosyltransferase